MARDKNLSIYDLAKKTGVSSGTISRVMNNRKGVSPGTRQMVLDAARHTGFRPRMAAKQVTVAVVADRVRYVVYGGYLSSMITHLVDELAKLDVAVEIYTEHNVERLGTKFVDGVLGMGWDDGTIDKLRTMQCPVVLLNRRDRPEFSSVATDHFQSAVLPVEYLLDRGHRRIGFLGIVPTDWGGSERLRGYRQTLQARGVPVDDTLIAFTQHRSTYQAVKSLMEHKPTALLVFSEDLVLEATYILTGPMGLNIPRDISLIGMENPKVSQFLNPPHTTIYQPLDQLAGQALGLLMQLIKDGRSEPVHVILKNELIERESVRRLETDHENQ